MESLKNEREQMIRAAWLWFVGGYTQELISDLLGISRIKVSRLISQAGKEKIVHVFIDGHEELHMEQEDLIKKRFQLDYCRICSSLGAGKEFDAVGNVSAKLLYDTIRQGSVKTIGLGNGRTIASVIKALPLIQAEGLKFVSLVGGLTRKASANPFDMIYKVCEKTNGDGFFMPTPIFADTVEDKEVFMQQKVIRRVLEMAKQCDFSLFGVGSVKEDSYMLHTGQITQQEFESLIRKNAVAEILGKFFDDQGELVEAELNRRSIGLPLNEMQGMNHYLVASGIEKLDALHAILLSGLIKGVLIEESLAKVFIKKFIKK